MQKSHTCILTLFMYILFWRTRPHRSTYQLNLINSTVVFIIPIDENMYTFMKGIRVCLSSLSFQKNLFNKILFGDCILTSHYEIVSDMPVYC